jgi:hypothetical protein
MAITLSNDILRDYAEFCGHARPADGVLHLLGMRSCRLYPVGEGKVAISLVEPVPNSFDDCVGMFGSDLALFPGTVDPGRFYSLHPERPAGCAHTVGLDEPGGRPFQRGIGRHKGKPAFVQQGSVIIWRDRDRDMNRDAAEPAHAESGNGLNLHRMGTIQRDIGLWSAGCWGVMNPFWNTFWERSAVAHPQASYTNYQFDAFRFATWYDRVRTA